MVGGSSGQEKGVGYMKITICDRCEKRSSLVRTITTVEPAPAPSLASEAFETATFWVEGGPRTLTNIHELCESCYTELKEVIEE